MTSNGTDVPPQTTSQADATLLGGTTPSSSPSLKSDRVAVVVNGNAKHVTQDVVHLLFQVVQDGDLFVSRDLESGKRIAHKLVDDGYTTVLTGGGDGTFVQFVTWVTQYAREQRKTPPRFGLLRLGTGNALAWVLGAQGPTGRHVVADLERLRSEGGSRKLRLIEVEGLLTPFAGIGFDAIALQHYAQLKDALSHVPIVRYVSSGALAYALSITSRSVPEYFVRPKMRVAVINRGDPAYRIGPSGQPEGDPIPMGRTIYEGPIQILAMSTIAYWGFGARAFPFADEREDAFHLRIANIGPLDIALHLKGLWKGTYRGRKLHDFLANNIEIRCEHSTPVQVGGDVIGERKVVHAALADEPVRVVDYYAPPPI